MKKRKEVEDDVNHHFSDFPISSSSPPNKIRRLDADLLLPPIMEEEELEIPPVYEQPMPTNLGHVIEDELSSAPDNVERAIVLFKPMNTPLLQSPSVFSISVNPELIAGFKNQVLWSSNSNSLNSTEEEDVKQVKNSGARNDILAVVPWVSSRFPTSTEAEIPQNDTAMEDEEMEAAAMDVEDKYVGDEQRPGNELGGIGGGLHQWSQQYCTIPQPSQNTSTPLVWNW